MTSLASCASSEVAATLPLITRISFLDLSLTFGFLGPTGFPKPHKFKYAVSRTEEIFLVGR